MRKIINDSKRIIQIYLFITIIFLPIVGLKVQASTGGLLDGVAFDHWANTTGTFYQKFTKVSDNDDTTYDTLGPNGRDDTFGYVFPSPVTIGSYRYLGDQSSWIKMIIYKSDGSTVSVDVDQSGVITNIPAVSNVVSIRFFNMQAKITKVYDANAYASNYKSYDEATNLSATMTYHSADLAWSIPDNPNLIGFKIYRDDKLIKTLDTIENYYLDDGLSDLTSYKYKVTALYDDGTETAGIENTFTTLEDPVVKKVLDAKAEAVSYKQINLSWTLPRQNDFHHVNIYRSDKPKAKGFFSSLLAGTIVKAATEPTKIFETNGTYFNDLTVKPDTSYEYTLTTQTVDGRVSDGTMVSADTPAEPTPVLKTDGNYTLDSSGNYVFKWTEPTTGTVKVLVDGVEYKSVNASLGKVVIPKSDMKTNIWGEPNVSMIPVGEFGTEGKEVTMGSTLFKSLKLPFQSNDLVTTIFGVLGLVAPIILLTLAIYYFKPIKRVIVNAASKAKERSLKNE
ncbi:hypothetical protein ACQYAD_08540 [Neobacillus sp. SM06]|uniref:hypothetical protein n=1 Tax=Neobacillus sp. SM06 TaxID=3422492 RepID=UPI003D2E258E